MKKIQLSLDADKEALLDRLMEGSYMTRAGFLVHLMAEEERRRKEQSSRRAPGRPKKGEGDEVDDDFPDENAPRTKTLPKHLEEYVIMPLRKNPVNDYDILMLEEKRRMHQEQSHG